MTQYGRTFTQPYHSTVLIRLSGAVFVIFAGINRNIPTNHFSHTYGVLGYEEPVNFNNPDYHKEFLDDIENEISRNSKAPFVKNFKNNYVDGKIPFYALVELFSFGTLSKFYKNMKSQDKKAVAQIYGVGYT